MSMDRRRSDDPGQKLDRISDLTEPLLLQILSFLPTRFAVRTSFLSRRFRHLWTFSPSIDLDRSEFPKGRQFVDVANRCFSRRDPSTPLLRLSLKTCEYPLPIKSLSKWLVTAHSNGLRHLSLQIDQETVEKILPLILSFHSLESVFIDNVQTFNWNPYPTPPIIPPKFNLTHLKSLHFSAQLKCSELTLLLSEQKNLEYLCYETDLEMPCILDLSSPTVKILKQSYSPICHVSGITLSFPIVESLELSMRLGSSLQYFNGDMPLLRNASIKIMSLSEECVSVFGDLLTSLINVEELDLSIETLYPKEEKVIPGMLKKRRKQKNENPFHPLADSGKELSIFPNLKRLKLSMCFHELSIEDLVCLLHNSPVLESLQLIHVANTEDCESNKSERWVSKLPVNSEGNNEHACFDDLNIGDKKIELVKKLLCTAQLSKKPKIL